MRLACQLKTVTTLPHSPPTTLSHSENLQRLGGKEGIGERLDSALESACRGVNLSSIAVLQIAANQFACRRDFRRDYFGPFHLAHPSLAPSVT
jgi:hypothetical protein